MQSICCIAMAAAQAPAQFIGVWSPYTLLIVVIMAFTSVILTVVLIAYSMMGRFRPSPVDLAIIQQADSGPDEDAAPQADIKAEIEKSMAATAKGEKKADSAKEDDGKKSEEKPASKSRGKAALIAIALQKTGVFSLLGAIFISIPAAFVFGAVDNVFGRMMGFTWGTGINLLLLCGQVFLITRFIILVRRHNKS